MWTRGNRGGEMEEIELEEAGCDPDLRYLPLPIFSSIAKFMKESVCVDCL